MLSSFMSFSSIWLLANVVSRNLSAVLSGLDLPKSLLDSISLSTSSSLKRPSISPQDQNVSL